MPVRLLKSSPFYLLTFLYFFFQSCNKPVDASYISIDSHTTADINKIESFHNSAIAVGGDAWTYGMILKFSNDSIDLLQETDKELINVRPKNDKLIAVGMNGYLFEISDQIKFFPHSQGQVARDLVETEDGLILVGGKSFGVGYISRMNNSNGIESTLDLPFELRSIARLGQRMLASGFGAVFLSDDEGMHWSKLDLDGDFFVRIARQDEQNCFITGQEGLIYQTKDGGTSWKSMRAHSRKQINGARIINNRLFLFCNMGIYQVYDPISGNWSVYQAGNSNLNDGLYFEGKLLLVGDDGFFGIAEL